MQFNDDTVMPWGKYKGKKLEDIPDDYFLGLWERLPAFKPGSKARRENPGLFSYIESNLEAIRLNVQNQKKY